MCGWWAYVSWRIIEGWEFWEDMCWGAQVFEKRKLDLSIFTFDESSNDHSFENMIQEPLIDQNFEELFENELICLDESTRDALVHYTNF